MARRICRLTDKKLRKTVDLRNYSKLIIDTINKIAPNKNPQVNEFSFSTDPLTHSESIRIGLALAEIPEIAELGIWVHTFRLFDGRIVEDKKEKNDDNRNNKKISNRKRNPEAIPSREQEANQSIGEAIS